MIDERDSTTTAELRAELFGVHVPELQLPLGEYRASFEAAELTAADRYLELGSGHGRGLVIAAKEFGADATGVEYLDDAIERTRRSAAKAGVTDRVHLLHDDLRRVDPAPFDVIHMHLGPAFHDVLAARLERVLEPRARVIAAGWRVPGWLPDTDALELWDGGYIYRPADPRRHASWGAADIDAGWVELVVHADLASLEPRLDGIPAPGTIALSHERAGRGQVVLVQVPSDPDATLTIWARCRAGRLTQRGPGWNTLADET
ncbi:MAG: hypothetical protein JWM86_57 [Thermoleophilia bacterium]|nr:hypothetical protein [Thermoleophilia bacterium]